MNNLMLLKIINAAVILMLVLLSFAILGNSMTKPLGRDEQMYCTGAVLLAQGKTIYRDFSYVAQMPYHPLLCAAMFKIFNTTHYLLVCRILSAFCDVLVVLCIVGIYRYIFKSFPICAALLSLAAAVLYVFNPVVDYANGFAWNNDVVILCVMLSLWLFVSTDFKRRTKYWRVAAIGALLTFATCMRITTAMVQLLFFAVLLTRNTESIKQRFKTILPFLAASAVVLLWPVWVIAQAPRAFFLDLVWIQMLNSEWLHKIGMVHNKFDLILSCVKTPGYLALIVIAAYLCVTVVWQRPWAQRRRLTPLEISRRLLTGLTISNKRGLLLAVLLVPAFFIIALILPAIRRQHLAAPVPLLIISAAYPLLYLRKLADTVSPCKHFNIAAALVAACVIVAVASYPIVLYRTPMLFNLQNWTAIGLHKISKDIGEKTKSPKLILTLAPLYALEGGCDIYTELSAGPFVYRVADYLSDWNLDITHTVGPRTLKKLLEESPPSAVILGTEPEFFEDHIFQTAVKPEQEKWERVAYKNGLVVYFRR